MNNKQFKLYQVSSQKTDEIFYTNQINDYNVRHWVINTLNLSLIDWTYKRMQQTELETLTLIKNLETYLFYVIRSTPEQLSIKRSIGSIKKQVETFFQQSNN